MAREIEEKGIHLLIHTEIGNDFEELRAMLNKAEELCDMVEGKKKYLANRKFDEILEICGRLVRAHASPPKKIPPPDKAE